MKGETEQRNLSADPINRGQPLPVGRIDLDNEVGEFLSTMMFFIVTDSEHVRGVTFPDWQTPETRTHVSRHRELSIRLIWASSARRFYGVYASTGLEIAREKHTG